MNHRSDSPVRRRFFEFAKVVKRIPLTIIVFTGIMLAVDAARSQFVLTPVPGLPGASFGPVAWGDYDNDGRLDFVIAGTIEGAHIHAHAT